MLVWKVSQYLSWLLTIYIILPHTTSHLNQEPFNTYYLRNYFHYLLQYHSNLFFKDWITFTTKLITFIKSIQANASVRLAKSISPITVLDTFMSNSKKKHPTMPRKVSQKTQMTWKLFHFRHCTRKTPRGFINIFNWKANDFRKQQKLFDMNFFRKITFC